VQLGFVIDHSRCIGCHACTVACKAENEVPVGSFRTWVKYTEQGTFPQVKRSFAVLRCNQCSHPPCVTICPVNALEKGPTGIVDVDPAACIGCKSCMQACPYDALYINDDTGTAEKCHFCAHRVESGLAPACAVVCPTEAIVPGDFDDPESKVSKLAAAGGLAARKTEAGTRPNVFYREAGEAGLDPALTNTAGGFLWANQQPGIQLDAQAFEALERRAEARTTYDVAHPPLWGWRVSAYLFTKSIAAGAFLVTCLLMYVVKSGPSPLGWQDGPALAVGLTRWGVLGALCGLVLTVVLLVADLKRPARFLFMLTRPNWNSWLVRGGVILTAYGLVLALFLAGGLVPWSLGDWDGDAMTSLWLAGVAAAVLTAIYTAWLFRQAKGRVLWMQRLLPARFLVQAVLAGAAWLTIGAVFIEARASVALALRIVLAGALGLHLLFMVGEHLMAPRGREQEFARASRLVTHGPFAMRHWVHGIALGVIVPLVGILVASHPVTLAVAGALALWGLWNEEDILVRAGQALPIS
jgi:Fe-S-cluster-containing dehydrogenase component/formate-dependent nitrite reductase membrane component NrfD